MEEPSDSTVQRKFHPATFDSYHTIQTTFFFFISFYCFSVSGSQSGTKEARKEKREGSQKLMIIAGTRRKMNSHPPLPLFLFSLLLSSRTHQIFAGGNSLFSLLRERSPPILRVSRLRSYDLNPKSVLVPCLHIHV